MLTLERIVFLVHPNCYLAASPDGRDERLRPYWERERRVEVEWKRGIDNLGEAEFLVLFSTHAGDAQHPVGVLARYAEGRLGARFLAVTSSGRFDDASFKAWTNEITKALKQKGLTYDPETVRCEAWGESFDGCVAGFSAFLTGTLGLAAPIEVLFDLTVPDMPFLVAARLVDRVRLPDKQLRLFLFEDAQRPPIGLFMPEVCKDGMKAYQIAVRADPARLHVYTKQGQRIEPSDNGATVPDHELADALARRTEDGIEISLRRDAPHPFFGGQLEGPLFFVGEGLSLKELRETLTKAGIAERSG